MFEEKDDTILARWLAGELTPDELAEFQKTEAFAEYQAIASASSRFLKPDYDSNALFDKLIAKREAQKTGRLFKLKPIGYVVGIAASIILLVGIFFNSVTYQTGIGEQLAVVLPDGSTVNLNGNSKLKHNRFFWNTSRSVSLKGEGFFDVESGSKFKVETRNGTVSVLGTEFNVRTRKDIMVLSCYEGKVQYEGKKQNKTILTQGQSILVRNNNIEKQQLNRERPTWLSGRSTFNNVTLESVLEELKAQYNITIKTNTIDLNQRFTGNFTHDNIDLALQTVLAPMNINYTFENSVLELTPQ